MGRISPKPDTSFTNLNVGSYTNYTEIKADGEINLHGTARVTKHIRVAAPSWHKGASAPADGDVGIWHTLDFDSASDDEAHYILRIPDDLASGSTIDVEVDWCYTGAQDNGTVCWVMEYAHAASGSTIDGSTTTITETSLVGRMTGRVERTTFTTGIIGAIPHNALGLHFYRDESEDTLGVDARMIEVHFEYLSDKLGESTS